MLPFLHPSTARRRVLRAGARLACPGDSAPLLQGGSIPFMDDVHDYVKIVEAEA